MATDLGQPEVRTEKGLLGAAQTRGSVARSRTAPWRTWILSWMSRRSVGAPSDWRAVASLKRSPKTSTKSRPSANPPNACSTWCF